MKKANQEIINNRATEIFDRAMSALNVCNGNYDVERLRSCQAVVLITDGYYILRSYNTIVAVIDRCDGICVDMLRKVYGYTATSAQHISKFFRDYDYYGGYGEKKILTFRP